MTDETITLFRPTGSNELALIREMDFAGFPPRLPEQPIFYPVTNEAYASQIARDWNTKTGDGLGFVTRFAVKKSFLDGFERKVVGGAEHEEYWIPAEDLEAFNTNIIGKIEVIREFTPADREAAKAQTKSKEEA
ncbi:hypothetical protein [Pelagibius sp.]|uniref:hypothetical protein n=1 Tax=Pelagibius sp. TaxID=1931238 RepID=UPI003BB104DD